jgi:hypothetical protein
MNRQDYYRAVLLGVVIGMGLLSILVLINPGEDVKPVEPDQKFEVVDTYKGRCDVVRYTDSSMATYKYFLDCSNK